MKQPSPFGMLLTVEEADFEKMQDFFSAIYEGCDGWKPGELGGIKFASMFRDGEVEVALFVKAPDNPLDDAFTSLRVNSVEESAKKIEAAGGKIMFPIGPCPCTGASFTIAQAPNGQQFMIVSGDLKLRDNRLAENPD
jgi:predicted enzyme related to lactoylglutathione lyase